jgi:putative holliday junction resolvase
MAILVDKYSYILAIDYGSKKIGTAITIASIASAKPLQVLNNDDKLLQNVKKIIKEWQISIIVVGYPLKIDNTRLDFTDKVDEFIDILENSDLNVKIYKQDERLTTKTAKEELFKKGGYKLLTKDNIDNKSACIILESFLEENL